MNCGRSVDLINSVINDFLKRKNIKNDNCPWLLSESPLGGIGVITARDIACGEEVFRDYPVIDGPRVKETNTSFCVVCYKHANIELCKKKCGLPICSEFCYQNHKFECEIIRRDRSSSDGVDIELLKNLTPLRCLQLGNEDKVVISKLKYHKGLSHGLEVDKLKGVGIKLQETEEDYMRLVCCVMDANAFEVSIDRGGEESNFRGLYPLAGLVNHSCVPNLTHAFDQKKRMIVKACVPIRKGEELFHSYVRLIWSSPTRQFNLLKTKHFICKCQRCVDPTEFGTYMSAILCKTCKGNVIPKSTLSINSNWVCQDCRNEVPKQNVANLLCALGSILRSFDDDDLEIMMKFLNSKLAVLVHENHEIAIDMKYRINMIIGHHEKYKLRDVDSKLLELKMEICEDLLKLLKNLKLGDNKLKGILSYELFTCLNEKCRRRSLAENNFTDKILTGKAESYLKEACTILTECVTDQDEAKI